jgi:predicted small lipoprotein YifL
MRYAVTALLIAVATVSLSGCGQTGPLYMPPVPEPEPVPATTPQAQPAAADSAEQQTKDP